jgi:hypothetical protein
MIAMDKLHSFIEHCQFIEMALKNKKAVSRLSKIPNAKKRLTEIIKLIAKIQKLTNEAHKMLDDLRADFEKEAEGE